MLLHSTGPPSGRTEQTVGPYMYEILYKAGSDLLARCKVYLLYCLINHIVININRYCRANAYVEESTAAGPIASTTAIQAAAPASTKVPTATEESLSSSQPSPSPSNGRSDLPCRFSAAGRA